jgi:hypothetical protein
MAGIAQHEHIGGAAPLWLLELQGRSSGDLLWDPRFLPCVNRQLEGIRLPSHNSDLTELLAEFLSGSPGNVEIVEGRYLQLITSKRHFGRNKALLWIDCQSPEASAGAVLRLYHRLGEDRVVIGVNTRGPERQIPPQFLAHAIRWLHSGSNAVVEIALADSGGRTRFLDPQMLGLAGLRSPLQRKVKRRRHAK